MIGRWPLLRSTRPRAALHPAQARIPGGPYREQVGSHLVQPVTENGTQAAGKTRADTHLSDRDVSSF